SDQSPRDEWLAAGFFVPLFQVVDKSRLNLSVLCGKKGTTKYTKYLTKEPKFKCNHLLSLISNPLVAPGFNPGNQFEPRKKILRTPS
ncbi:MAG: hypothetical protein JXR54_04240, partial [Tannerellaceae bacterium]|nr:hypothetical protein [Tannerellaceae bacterium]